MEMRNVDLSPFHRNTIGFDRLFQALEANVSADWPPYDIHRTGENDYRITMAVAGFSPDEIEMTQHGNTLQVSGERKTEKDAGEVLHRGIAARKFKQTFKLADHVKVVSADLKNGMLVVSLAREVPEELKPRRIQIATADGASNENSPQIESAAA
jgi:molecular chaperone IbpA